MAKKAVTFEIINIQTGEKKTVRDNLYESLFKGRTANGKQLWKKKSEIAGESLGITEPIKVEKLNLSNVKEVAVLKVRISELEKELEVCQSVNFPTKTNEKEVTINPFDIVDAGLLKNWLIENNIPFPKTVKKLETLRNHIPEIYK